MLKNIFRLQDSQQDLANMIDELLSGDDGDSQMLEATLTNHDAENIIAQLRILRLLHTDGRLIGLSLIIRNITE